MGHTATGEASGRAAGSGPAGRRRRPAAGRLKIGDEWMAIQIIARSQTNPQKAVAEIVENSIDAGATRIVITRGRRRGRVFLRVSDDGRGVPLSAEGLPDFDYVATHICDSLKRRLDDRQRDNVQGEFGIGLLGFWAIGRELEMVSQAGTAPPCVMTMKSGSRAYDRRRFLGARSGSGVDVTIHEVHREAQSRLTAEKLQRYLGEELRERIRRAGVTIVIEDRLPPRRTLEVRPAVFTGERITEIIQIPVRGRAPIRAEIYLAPEGDRSGADAAGRSGEAASREGDAARLAGNAAAPSGGAAGPPAVALYRLGTRVCGDIALLPEFAREPWNTGRLEGALDYADFRLGPATREGFLPDAAYHAFVEAVREVEPLLFERLRREDEARAESASRSLVRELQSAFARVLRSLPAGEYDWFGDDGPRPFAGDGTGRPGGADAVPGGHADEPSFAERSAEGGESDAGAIDAVSAESGAEIEGAEEPLPAQRALVTGPLDRAVIRPAEMRVAVGRRRRATALALDATGAVIERDVVYSWSLTPGIGSLAVEPGGRAVLEAGERPARGTLTVEVRDEATGVEPLERTATADVLVEAEAPRRAFPPPTFVHSPGEPWRSRWNTAEGRLEVNSAHPDYLAVRENPPRRRRYLGRLYAKELVLHNFGHEAPPAVLERLLEVLTRLEEHL